MVTKLKDNHSYINYIRKKMDKNFPEWEENSVAYENQPNNNFGITFKLADSKIQFIKDRGQLELIFNNKYEIINFGNIINISILDKIPEQNPNWLTSICTELIDYYIDSLKLHFEKEDNYNLNN